MKTNLFNYYLPKKLIAQFPKKPRHHSRLLVYNRINDQIIHDYFYNLEKYLKAGDLLVFNDTKVFPARLWGQRATGGKNEVLLLKPVKEKIWKVLIGGKVRRIGLVIKFGRNLQGKVVKKLGEGVWWVRFNKSPKNVLSIAKKIGFTPTPPYIKQKAKLSDYQTIYAKKIGSVAAPTAGFHFTNGMLKKLKKKGIQFEYITLHVGYGTFQPVKVDDIKKHKMHAEYVEIDKNTIRHLIQAKKEGRRIIAVGTTTVRTLETFFREKTARGYRGWIDTFIYPGYKFRFVDAVVTNFHLPKSTLLMLVAAFVGRKKILEIYKKAIQKKYRFYSFGDGMLIY